MITLPDPPALPPNVHVATIKIGGHSFLDVELVEIAGEHFPTMHRSDFRVPSLREAIGDGADADVTMEDTTGIPRTTRQHLAPLRTYPADTTDPE